MIYLNIPLVNLKRQSDRLRDEIHASLDRVIDSGQFIMGDEEKTFEKEIASFVGTTYGIGVGNGTDALIMALRALNIGPGDEVITSPFTFFASAESISSVGATPVFVDISPDTYCMDVDMLYDAITPRTKAIIPVHIFGHMVDMKKLMEIAKARNLAVIEDACQAIGATQDCMRAGAIGDAGCFSFFPTKNLGGMGDGGMVVTNRKDMDDAVRMFRVHGSRRKYHNECIGYNSRLDELQAAILRVKLRYLSGWEKKRRYRARIYNEELKNLPIKLPIELDEYRHVYHLYVIGCDERDGLMSYLKDKGIGCGVYYPLPLHLLPVYRNLGYGIGRLKNAEGAAITTLAIPLCPELNDLEQEYVIDSIKEFYGVK